MPTNRRQSLRDSHTIFFIFFITFSLKKIKKMVWEADGTCDGEVLTSNDPEESSHHNLL